MRHHISGHGNGGAPAPGQQVQNSIHWNFCADSASARDAVQKPASGPSSIFMQRRIDDSFAEFDHRPRNMIIFLFDMIIFVNPQNCLQSGFRCAKADLATEAQKYRRL
jgi:hypothetical protein